MDAHEQLARIIGLLIDNLKKIHVYNTVSWLSQKPRRPTKNVRAAGVLAAQEGIESSKKAAACYSEVLDTKVTIHLVINSKNLFRAKSTPQNSVSRPSRGDVGAVWFQFAPETVENIVWIWGCCTLEDGLTKPDSLSIDALQLTLHHCLLSNDLEDVSKVKEIKNTLGEIKVILRIWICIWWFAPETSTWY